MRKPTIRHDNLRKILEQMDFSNLQEDLFEKLLEELKHSCLIFATAEEENGIDYPLVNIDDKIYGFVFTDMDEFKKVFKSNGNNAKEFSFGFYCNAIKKGILDGFVINPMSEAFPITKEMMDLIEDLPQDDYSSEVVYTKGELKDIKDSINNIELDEFIKDPKNIGKYEELFEKISSSTMLTLMLSHENLTSLAEDGVISMVNTGPLGFLYIDELGGEYATVYTSEDKINNVRTPLNKYSQIVNFSLMVNFILNDDMDGIIINPEDEHILLTRDVLLEFSQSLEKTCNDSRLNKAILYMFVMENEVYV